MGLKVYISGKLYGKNDARISVFDHGLLYGDGGQATTLHPSG